ncbi:hypothetical protein HYY74_00110 [Candidatus Woesearchaeota archaeon]|nr:hypothetical protein [Candidatus Woesearchaeota archaeon]
MAELKLKIPEDVKLVMDQFKTVDWSSVARSAIVRKAEQLAFLKHFSSDSTLTEEEALELGRKVSRTVSRKYLRMV